MKIFIKGEEKKRLKTNLRYILKASSNCTDYLRQSLLIR